MKIIKHSLLELSNEKGKLNSAKGFAPFQILISTDPSYTSDI